MLNALSEIIEIDHQMVPFPALPQDGTTVQGELLPPMVLKQEEEDIRHTHQVVNCALGTLTKDGWLDFFHVYLGSFSVQEEEKDLSEDLLRLKVYFGEVLEEKEEDAALVDFLSQLHLGIKEMFLFSKEL